MTYRFYCRFHGRIGLKYWKNQNKNTAVLIVCASTFSFTLLKNAVPSFFMVDVHSLYCCFNLELDFSEYLHASSSNSSENPRPLFNIVRRSSMNCEIKIYLTVQNFMQLKCNKHYQFKMNCQKFTLNFKSYNVWTMLI